MTHLLETLTSYVPRLVARHCASNPALLTNPVSDHIPAAVLFADISGFTALTEQLAQHGPSGVEELACEINAYFSQILDLIEAHGGDVLKFAGDALLALWPSQTNDLQAAIQHAAWCALEIHKRIKYFYHLIDGPQLVDQRGMAIALINLGFTVWEQGDFAAAAHYFYESLRQTLAIGALPLALEALVGIARLYAQQSQQEQAAELLGLALSHPSSNTDVEMQAKAVLEEIATILDSTQLEAALERGKQQDLQIIAQAILADFRF